MKDFKSKLDELKKKRKFIRDMAKIRVKNYSRVDLFRDIINWFKYIVRDKKHK